MTRTLGRVPSLGWLAAVLLAGCGRVDMSWDVDQGERDPIFLHGDDDHDAGGPFALGATAGFVVEHPRYRKDLAGWDLAVSPPTAASVIALDTTDNRLKARVRFVEEGEAELLAVRADGREADQHRVEVARAADADLRSYVDDVTGHRASILHDDTLHLVVGADVGFLVDWFDDRARPLMGSDLVNPRVRGGDRVQVVAEGQADHDEGGDYFCLRGEQPTDERVPLEIVAGPDVIREVFVEVHGPEEVDRLALVHTVETHDDGVENADRTGWVVARGWVGEARALGAPVDWYQDGEFVGTAAFAEVLAPSEHERESRRSVTACVSRVGADPEQVPLATDALCATTRITGRLGGLGRDAFGSFCGCAQSPVGAGWLGLGVLSLALVRRRRHG